MCIHTKRNVQVHQHNLWIWFSSVSVCDIVCVFFARDHDYKGTMVSNRHNVNTGHNCHWLFYFWCLGSGRKDHMKVKWLFFSWIKFGRGVQLRSVWPVGTFSAYHPLRMCFRCQHMVSYKLFTQLKTHPLQAALLVFPNIFGFGVQCIKIVQFDQRTQVLSKYS